MARLDFQTAALVCPRCDHKNIKTIGWIKANSLVHCDGCGNNISLQRDNLLPELEEAEEALERFLDDVRQIAKSR
jgi:transposase-like protein